MVSNLRESRDQRRSAPRGADLRAGPLESRAATALFAVQVLSLVAMAAIVATKLWQDHIWIGFVLLAAALAVWLPELKRPRLRRWWFAYVAGIFLYTLLRSFADETWIPIQTFYVIRFDQIVFFDREPVAWLQDRLFRPDQISALDIAAVEVHWSFFLAPHAAAVLIFLWKRPLFPRYTALVVGTMFLGLVLFFLLPTTPPWLAARAGDIPQSFRVMDFVGGRVQSDTYRQFYASLGEPNSVAAMPSIHMAVTFAMYLWAREHTPKLAPWLLVYSLIMGLSLIYLAEHYMLDLLAGVACAYVCHLLSRRLVPPVEEQRAAAAP